MSLASAFLNVRNWILAAIAVGFIFGDVGGEHDATLIIVFLMIMMCFSLTKLDFSFDDVGHYRSQILLAVVLSSIVATLITLFVGSFYGESMWSGWVILACVPCAISVVSGTMFMRGDGKLVTLSITAIYALAIILTPLFSHLLIGNAINPLEIVKYVLLFILIPLMVAVPLRKANIPENVNKVVINFTFFMFALIAIGKSRDIFFNDLDLAFSVIIATAVRVAVAHLLFEYISRYFGIMRGHRVAYSLILVWRNSGLALALVLLLFPSENMAIVPAAMSMIFEQFYFMFMMWYYEHIVPPDVQTA